MEKEIDAVQSPKLKKCILKISEIGKNAKITASVEGSQNTKKISLIIRLYKKEGDGYVL